ncbi:MAG: glycosyltransferase 87 family protein, partial [Candidatus Eisenbacteria bacterium]
FIALAGLPAAVAMAAFMWAKVVVLAALVVGWWRRYVPRASVIAVALLALYGANRSAQWDLAAGNVALFECALLYAAFDQWLHGRRVAFAALVVAASLLKLTPAVFLLLLLVPLPGHAPRPGVFAAACALLAALVAGPMLVGPAAHFTPFFAHVPDATSYTETNPSSLGFLTVSLSRLGFPWAQPAGLALWLAYGVALLTASRAHLRETARLQHGTRWLMTAVLLYVLIHPRVMAYGYVLATPALLYFMPRPLAGRVGSLLLALVLCAQGLLVQLTNNMSGSVFVLYAPFLMTLSVWLLAAAQVPRATQAEIAEPARRAA